MHNIRKITDNLYYIGGNDRKLALFENVYPVPQGISYNSYLLTDEKTVLTDTADSAIAPLFFENLQHALQGRPLDYLVVHHMEPDHCALIAELLRLHPETTVVWESNAFFFHILFYYGLSQDIEYSSLCYAVGPCCLSIPNVIVCIC